MSTKLDEYLAAAGDQASTILDNTTRVPLGANVFRNVVRDEWRRRERDEPMEAEAAARDLLNELIQSAKKAPQAAVESALDKMETLVALAFLMKRDRGEVEKAFLELQSAGCKVVKVRALRSAVSAEMKQPRLRLVSSNEPVTLLAVRSVLSDAPVSDNIVIPRNYQLSKDGIQKISSTSDAFFPQRIASAPVLLSGRLKDIADGNESVRLAWYRDGRYQSHTVQRGIIANARQVVDLANTGFPVTSGTAKAIVDYLADFESVNIETIPLVYVSNRLGWQGEKGKLGFLWGQNLISPDEDQVATLNIESLPPTDWREDWVAFYNNDPGSSQLVKGFRAEGSFEGWTNAMQLAEPYPRVLLGLYSALAPPLLEILRAPNFVVDWSGPTTIGKTTVLRGAASVWGNPDERTDSSILGTWDVTKVWLERAAATMHSLPLFLDETKRAKSPATVAQAIYEISQGRGRGRGSLQGIRQSGSWATVLLSTGETPITAFTQSDGGTYARVLEVWGSPWGKTDEFVASLVRDFNRGVCANYGHAGPRFIRYLLRQRGQWEEWRTAYKFAQQGYLDKAGTDAVAGRLAAYFATLDVTAAIAHEALPLPWDYPDPVAALWDDLTKEASGADRAAEALSVVVSWAYGHDQEFWGRSLNDDKGAYRQPHTGWAGRWDADEEWKFISFLPHKLNEILRNAGFEGTEAILRQWRDREWLDVGTDKPRFEKRVRMNTERSWLVVIRRHAIDGMSSEGDGDSGDTVGT